MGSHTMDLAWNAIDAGLPTSAEGKGDPFNAEVTPVKLEMHFEIPANDWRHGIQVSWYQGGAMPESPNRGIDLKKIDHGAMFEGSKGCLVADFQTRLLLPQGNEADLTYYKPRGKAALIPPVGAISSNNGSTPARAASRLPATLVTRSDMIEMMLLGLVAYRAGKKIKYDGAAGQGHRLRGSPTSGWARSYREGWTLNG